MNLTNLPSEIHLQIFSYLPQGCIYNLLLTCKQIYPTAHQQLWSCLGFLSTFTAENTPSDSNDINAYLARISLSRRENFFHFPRIITYSRFNKYLLPPLRWRILIDPNLNPNSSSNTKNNGWGLVKRIILGGFDVLLEDKLMNALREKIEAGNLNPQFIEIYLGDGLNHTYDPLTAARSFFSTINSHANAALLNRNKTEYNPPSLTLQIPSSTALKLDCFPLNTITTLSLGISPSSREDFFNPASQILQIAEYLTTASSSLRSLTLNNTHNGTVLQPLEQFSSVLEALQQAFTNLTALQKLKFSFRFFNASLFISPPENVRVLCYDDFEATEDWWYQLSKAELRNVEWLKVGIRWYHCGVSGDKSDVPNVGTFSGKKLKCFYLEGNKGSIPKGLADCVLRANPGLVENGKGSFGLKDGDVR
ncbi:hypothetical protein AOL_s00097g444 [Orbilia oligospora ATCC 24927]|uniref:F-box domain-containing protein n=1 Tax=Arthrobotrys oligospora (strain ATCC 24927 / CBS 115.81 / DSM 1491) TaxID=756982 RepID=G1XJB7_ARTOA|nr:hypothetical protein AOL_s00097g444 [Orbilia oligospora ATCC 24927]EGX46696.1 hypothetical protein AOL_s00097g444 [Orbilia oligospora ATCC 24927]